MFGRDKPVVFDPYRRRRSRWRVPRWLILLLLGIAIGAGGVVYVQERHLPPRLSAAESAQLRSDYEHAESERARLQHAVEDASQRLETALADKKSLSEQLAASRRTADGLRADAAALVAALPPDPRGGAVAVRAARFTREGDALAYDVVLSREQGGAGKPFTGVVQFTVAGASAKGVASSIDAEPVPVTIAGFENLSGSLPLPEGFVPKQTTIRVLDKPEGKSLGMRVMYVQ